MCKMCTVAKYYQRTCVSADTLCCHKTKSSHPDKLDNLVTKIIEISFILINFSVAVQLFYWAKFCLLSVPCGSALLSAFIIFIIEECTA